MRLTRERGPVELRRRLEAAYQAKTGMFAPYCEIAAGLYDDHPTAQRVRDEIASRYGVSATMNTVSRWINQGIEARRAVIARAEERIAA